MTSVVNSNNPIAGLNRSIDRQPPCSRVHQEYQTRINSYRRFNLMELNNNEFADMTPLFKSLGGRYNAFTPCLSTLEGHSSSVISVALSKDGQRVVSGSDDKTVKIWDATSGECVSTLEGHSSVVMSVALSEDGQRVVSGSRDKTVKIWDATSGECVSTLEGHSSEVV